MLMALGVYTQMYRGRPCWGSNLDHRRANPPLWPLGTSPNSQPNGLLSCFVSNSLTNDPPRCRA
jgi:hypothetical protein